MDQFQFTSFIGSIVSVVLGLLAIALSIIFFWMTYKLSQSTRESSNRITDSVDKLEELFGKLYSDTFSVMRDTVSDMRRHMWPADTKETILIGEETEAKIDQKTAALKSSFDKELGQLLKRQEITDEKITSLKKELTKIVDRTIAESRKVEEEVREETLRDRIRSVLVRLSKKSRRVEAYTLVNKIGSGFDLSKILDEIHRMKEEGILFYDGNTIQPDTKINLRQMPVP